MSTLTLTAPRQTCPTMSEEEFRAMTFQVGFFASDGVLLASDLKKTALYGFSPPRLEPKIEIHKSGNFAHCSAGDTGFTTIVIDEIEKEISRGKQFIDSNNISATSGYFGEMSPQSTATR